HEDAPARLQRDGVAEVLRVAELGLHEAAAAKRRIEPSVREVAGEAEARGAAELRCSRDDEPAVRLESEGASSRLAVTHPRRHLAGGASGGAEVRVGQAVAVV